MKISIPAFREEGDFETCRTYSCKIISIPAFREEGDYSINAMGENEIAFQSPPSVRKATNPKKTKPAAQGISIPAFREEGDLFILSFC